MLLTRDRTAGVNGGESPLSLFWGLPRRRSCSAPDYGPRPNTAEWAANDSRPPNAPARSTNNGLDAGSAERSANHRTTNDRASSANDRRSPHLSAVLSRVLGGCRFIGAARTSDSRKRTGG